MSKAIKMTEEMISVAIKDFKESLLKGNFPNGKVSYTTNLASSDAKAQLVFTEEAWLKMQALIDEFDSEVGWHGVAERGNRETNEYIIKDIVVFPQEVSGATVNTDQAEYEKWLMSIDDDVFNSLRMQGHSHVNMGVTPSSVDESLYEKILDQLKENDFYIFLIYNKRGDKTIKIYDMEINTLFEEKDTEVFILQDLVGIQSFIEDAQSIVKKKTYTYTPAYKDKKDDKKDKKQNLGLEGDVIPYNNKADGHVRKGTRIDPYEYYREYEESSYWR